MLPLDTNLRHEGRATEFLFVWVNTIWAAVLLLAFAQTCCDRFPLLSEKCSLFTSLGAEDRTSTQQKYSSGEHNIFWWLFDVPEKSDLLARHLCKSSCLEHLLHEDVVGIPCTCKILSVVWLHTVVPCTNASDFQESGLLWKPKPWKSGSEGLLLQGWTYFNVEPT